jgi:hypothetical protein
MMETGKHNMIQFTSKTGGCPFTRHCPRGFVQKWASTKSQLVHQCASCYFNSYQCANDLGLENAALFRLSSCFKLWKIPLSCALVLWANQIPRLRHDLELWGWRKLMEVDGSWWKLMEVDSPSAITWNQRQGSTLPIHWAHRQWAPAYYRKEPERDGDDATDQNTL